MTTNKYKILIKIITDKCIASELETKLIHERMSKLNKDFEKIRNNNTTINNTIIKTKGKQQNFKKYKENSNHKHDNNCNENNCNYNDNIHDKKTSEFIKKANIVHNNKYNYSKVDYKNSNERIIIICENHGEFSQNTEKTFGRIRM